MKKILYLLCSCFAVTLMASCEDFLDKTPQGDKTDQDIFSRFNETESLINRLYFYARAADQPLVHIRFFSDSALTDECEGSSAENGWSNKFNDGDWEPGSQLYTSCNATTNSGACHTFWPKLYEDIRCANVILEGIEKYNTPDSEARPGTLSQRIGEVLFIRAYLHYCVLKSYGECPYVDYTVNPNALPPFERENIHTIVEKICRDCDEAYARVPAQNLMDQFGRVEKGACLALKAMALWIAATPLYNGSTLKGDTRNYASVYQSYDPARWDAAAAAAKAVMDFEAEGQKRYSLYQGSPKSQTTDSGGTDQSNGAVYSRLWELFHRTMNDAKKAEWIFFHLHCKTVGYHNDMYPPSAQGQAREVPVQDQVDEYEVIGPDGYGYPIYALKQNHKALYGSLISEQDMAKAYDDGNPYVNRDPRFYRDIIYHGSMFKGKWINTATGADAINAANSTSTGYFTRKYFDGYYTKGMSGNWNFDAPLIRLATIYLVYAEAVTRSKGATPRGLQPDERAACPFVHGPHPAGRADQQGVTARLHPARTPRRALPRKEPLLLDAVLPRTDQPRRTGQGCPVEFDPGDERPEGTVVFRQIRRLPQDAAPHLRHAPRGRPQRQDIGGRQNLPHGTLLEGGPRIPREALPLPDPDRRVAAGQHSAKPQLVIDNHRPDRPNRRSG